MPIAASSRRRRRSLRGGVVADLVATTPRRRRDVVATTTFLHIGRGLPVPPAPPRARRVAARPAPRSTFGCDGARAPEMADRFLREACGCAPAAAPFSSQYQRDHKF